MSLGVTVDKALFQRSALTNARLYGASPIVIPTADQATVNIATRVKLQKSPVIKCICLI